MNSNTDYGKIAYMKTEEMEEKVSFLNSKVNELELLYGVTPEPEDPNDTPDEPYTPPAPGTIITTGAISTFNYYVNSTGIYTSPAIYFTSDQNSTLIIKKDINIQINSNPCDLAIELFIDDTLVDTYNLSNPSIGDYQIPFAVSYTSSTINHKIHCTMTPAVMYQMSKRTLNSEVELLGNNVDFLTSQKKYTIYMDNGDYYISKCETGESNVLETSISAPNIGADYTKIKDDVVEQLFCGNYQQIDGIWQTAATGIITKNGFGNIRVEDYADSSIYYNCGSCIDFDHAPNYKTTYSGIIILSTKDGDLEYLDINKTLNYRTIRTLEANSTFYVNVSAVKIVDEDLNSYVRKAKFIATKADGTNVFFDAVSVYNNLDLGYGSNVSAYYNSLDGSVINVYMRVYNQLVKKVLTFNTSTSLYELTSEVAIGTWDRYFEGRSPAYFTISNKTLGYFSE
jgi:hypothetical protein